jgi:hypothetical protein
VHTTTQFGMEISPQKSEVMAYKGHFSIRSKIVTDNTTLEQVNTFTYFGCKISYEEEKDITSKISFKNSWNSEQ